MGKIIQFISNVKGETQMISIYDAAHAFLNIDLMSNKKLQKLCYYAQAWYMALNDEQLIDCNFEAWTHGPVCPELYHRFKIYGGLNISERFECPKTIGEDKYLKGFIDGIYSMYGKFQANELEEMTHNEDPWLNSREGLNKWEPGYNLITLDAMKKYYNNLKKV